jgi:hypothetical protein
MWNKQIYSSPLHVSALQVHRHGEKLKCMTWYTFLKSSHFGI